MTHILVADDDLIVGEVVRRYLENDGFTTTLATTGTAALAELNNPTRPTALAVLDVMLPDTTGIALCERIRNGHSPHLPIILLTALSEENDRIVGLTVGADDYVTKPFSPRELVLRVHALLRRAQATPPAPQTLTDGPLTIETAASQVLLGGQPVSMTRREFDLLTHLVRNSHTVFSREQLLEQVWNWSFGDLSTVTVHVKRLRGKLGPNCPIETVWGRGYRWSGWEE